MFNSGEKKMSENETEGEWQEEIIVGKNNNRKMKA